MISKIRRKLEIISNSQNNIKITFNKYIEKFTTKLSNFLLLYGLELDVISDSAYLDNFQIMKRYESKNIDRQPPVQIELILRQDGGNFSLRFEVYDRDKIFFDVIGYVPNEKHFLFKEKQKILIKQ